ncbi:MAG: S8 family peptidase [Alphaproteobacteria bacterium]
MISGLIQQKFPSTMIGALIGLSIGAFGTAASGQALLDPLLEPVFDIVSDPEFQTGKANEIIGAQHLYARGIDGSGIRVAVADTGIMPWWTGHVELPHTRFKKHIDFFGLNEGQKKYKLDEFIHGHAIASIIGAEKNGLGAHGIAYGVDLYNYKIVSSRRNLAPRSPDHVASMFQQVRRDRIDVMSGAWGWWNYLAPTDWDSDWMRGAMQPFVDEIRLMKPGNAGYRGTALVFAAGNQAMPDPSNLMAMVPYWFPDVQSQMLSVVALDVTDWESGDPVTDLQPASYSSYCGVAKDWCLAAPAHGVRVLWFGGYLGVAGGTSAATAVTTGALALLMDAFPEINAEDAIAIVLETATDIGAPGVDDVFGHGLLNLEAAIQPLGEPVITVNGSTATASASFVETSSLLGGGFDSALGVESFVFQDKYGRYYTSSFGTVEIGSQFDDTVASQTDPAPSTSFAMLGDTGLGFSDAGGVAYQGNDEGISLHFAIGQKADRAILGDGVLPFDHIDGDAVTGVMRLGRWAGGGLNLGVVVDDNTPTAFAAFQAQITDAVSWQAGVMAEQDRLHGAEGGGVFAWRGQTLTGWTGLNANWQMGEDMWFGANALAGYLSYKSDDDVVVTNLTGMMIKGALQFTKDNGLLRGDRFQLTASVPATILDGAAQLQLPSRSGLRHEDMSFANEPAYEVKASWSLQF